MENLTGESDDGILRLDFDRRLMLQFRGSVVTSDAGLLAYRELDDALGLSTMAGEILADARTGRNGRHALAGLLQQSVFGRLAGYEDVNDAERLRHTETPVLRHPAADRRTPTIARYFTGVNGPVAMRSSEKPQERCVFLNGRSAIAALNTPLSAPSVLGGQHW